MSTETLKAPKGQKVFAFFLAAIMLCSLLGSITYKLAEDHILPAEISEWLIGSKEVYLTVPSHVTLTATSVSNSITNNPQLSNGLSPELKGYIAEEFKKTFTSEEMVVETNNLITHWSHTYGSFGRLAHDRFEVRTNKAKFDIPTSKFEDCEELPRMNGTIPTLSVSNFKNKDGKIYIILQEHQRESISKEQLQDCANKFYAVMVQAAYIANMVEPIISEFNAKTNVVKQKNLASWD
ncbi:hypothetical protein [Neptuniibacter sp. QD37_11]|uniref:hypothetical protein n=1 Tax=Neptuniibacter sp. QD37_11 TaxID=3398209 RepID=UPI0039F4DAD5